MLLRAENQQNRTAGKDELMLTIKNNRKQYRLLVSASASLPLVYLTDQNKTGPMTAPEFLYAA